MRVDQALVLSERLAGLTETPRLDVELLLCHVLQKPRSYLYTWPEKRLSAEQQQAFLSLLARRESGEPVAHLTGERGFWTLALEVNASTLIPRPETELLVEWALQHLPEAGVRMADLGTGTGAIALALASERPDWQIQATELQVSAVELARRNARRLGLDQVEVLQGSWCEPLSGHYDLLISNPPYIDPQHPCLIEGDLRYEPRSALVAPLQGMADILTLIAQAPDYLKPDGWLVFEHGYDQGQAVQQALLGAGFSQCFTWQDLNGKDRITGGRYVTE